MNEDLLKITGPVIRDDGVADLNPYWENQLNQWVSEKSFWPCRPGKHRGSVRHCFAVPTVRFERAPVRLPSMLP